MKSGAIAKVMIPIPLRRVYDFIVPDEHVSNVRIGARVRVPFGRRQQVTGIVYDVNEGSNVPANRLRAIETVLDAVPIFDETLWQLLCWAAEYYHHPIGEVMYTALPARLRGGAPLIPKQAEYFALTEVGRDIDTTQLQRAPLQKQLMALLHTRPSGVSIEQLGAVGGSWRRALAVLRERGWIETVASPVAEVVRTSTAAMHTLSEDQSHAFDQIRAVLDQFNVFCLYGVTGSGKTEVYMRVIETVLAQNNQALVLVPEIGLTPQLIARFEQRFATPITVLHSQMSDAARHRAWWQASEGHAKIVLGTRSAVFVPLQSPGVIIIDEEHDPSYKQQDGFRYHARDLALYRARLLNVPVVLGSATPSLETLANVDRGRYTLLRLPVRAGGSALPQIELVDTNSVPMQEGIARSLLDSVRSNLVRGEQSLIFINRRGFAPILHCLDCGWQAECGRCDARLIYHQASGDLRCHHCGTRRPVPSHCETCQSDRLKPMGAGTQRVESILREHFSDARIVRIDRDTTRSKEHLGAHLETINSGEADILIGTQLLAKGHHFPKVTLVVVLNVDQSLFGIDFRSEEMLVQQLLQVAGRAGREQHAGKVFIQTAFPKHPVFAALQDHDYDRFTREALTQRAAAGFPPYHYFALLRAEATRPGDALSFLGWARNMLRQTLHQKEISNRGLQIGDPVPAPMEKRAGRYRAHLLLHAAQRRELHSPLQPWLMKLEGAPQARRVRWSLDIDPTEML